MIQDEESDETWSLFFDYLKTRGLSEVEMVISDAHKGLVKAIKKSFTNASWQRCQVHFMRNILNCILRKIQNLSEKKSKHSSNLRILKRLARLKIL